MTDFLQYTVFNQGGQSEPVGATLYGRKATQAKRVIREISGSITLGRMIPELGIRVDRVEGEVAPWEAA